MADDSQRKSIKRVLFLSFVAVGLLPLIFLGWQNIQFGNDEVNREVKEKHLLLAQNLTFSISSFLSRRMQDVKNIASQYASSVENTSQLSFADTQASHPNFLSLSIVKQQNIQTLHSVYQTSNDQFLAILQSTDCLKPNFQQQQQQQILPIVFNHLSDEPSLFICQPLPGEQITLVAEINTEYFRELQANIVFGRKGHAAIVNNYGQVVAHPNKEWVKASKNLSGMEIIKLAISGKSGVIEFHSGNFNQQMISGYASVADFHWGVIVPQPLYEVEAQMDAALYRHILLALLAFTTAIALTGFFVRKISNPLASLSRDILALKASQFQGELPPPTRFSSNEVVTLHEVFNEVLDSFKANQKNLMVANDNLNEGIEKATKALQESNRKLQRIITLDELTNVYNRRGLKGILTHEVARVKRDAGSFTVLLCDLDNFKSINDNYGHAAGDDVLRTFAKIARKALRERDVVGRWGGEEFLCILGDADYETAFDIAERLRILISTTEFLSEITGLGVTVSIGLANFPVDADNIDNLLVCADKALYEAKNAGRNKTHICSQP